MRIVLSLSALLFTVLIAAGATHRPSSSVVGPGPIPICPNRSCPTAH